MACKNLIRFSHHSLNTRKFHAIANKLAPNWKHDMKKELESGKAEEIDNLICIYKVPSNMLMAEREAYTPKNISIGPYHHESPRVRNMDVLKRNFYRRLFNPNNGSKLDEAFKLLEEQESKARRCYMEEYIKPISRDKFLQMMLIDASFIIQLLRDFSAGEFKQVPAGLNRWMVPIIRHELIMLENQLPMCVLNKLFELTRVDDATSSKSCKCLRALALRFFYPLLHMGPYNNPKCTCDDLKEKLHLLDLLRSSISPKLEGEKSRGTEDQMVRSVTELMEAGVRIKTDKSRQLLDITFRKKWCFRELTIPLLYINDHRGTVFRNMVAFENCHKMCKPDVTTYLFFFNGLVNSSDDVSLLHYKGVLHHSLGNDKSVAKLINNITKEIIQDKDESYLYKVVTDANSYYYRFIPRKRSWLVHHYLKNWIVGVSTIGAIFGLYFTFIQSVCSFADVFEKLQTKRFGCHVADMVAVVYRGTLVNNEEQTKRIRSQVAAEYALYPFWGYSC